MNLLLDTHTIIWYLENAEDIPDNLIKIIEETENKIIVSVVSFWEVAIKITIGKLPITLSIDEIESQLRNAQIDIISITVADTKRYLALPLHHRDPFDRMLIAQGLERDFIIASRDETFDRYGVNRFW